MSTEENKKISWRLQEEVFGQGKLMSVDELLAPDYVSHAPGDPELSRGPEDIRHIVRARTTRLSPTLTSLSRSRSPKGTWWSKAHRARNAGNTKPFPKRNVQPSATIDRTLVKRLGQRLESARRLSFCLKTP